LVSILLGNDVIFLKKSSFLAKLNTGDVTQRQKRRPSFTLRSSHPPRRKILGIYRRNNNLGLRN